MERTITTIQEHARELNLTGLAVSVDVLLEEARKNEPSYSDFALALLERELSCRRHAHLERRRKVANLPFLHDLDHYDSGVQNGISQVQLQQLRQLLWLDQNYNLILIGPSGSALFFPAAILVSYPFFLVGLFVVGLGFAMLQIAANPYVTILGPESTASSRLNLSQAFNSFGTTIGPIIGGWLIFTVFNRPGTNGADSVKIPYLCFAGVFLLLAVFFKFAHLPNFANKDHISRGAGPLKYPHVVLGMLAIFMYVGGEVSVGSMIINYLGLPNLGGLKHEAASKFLAFYWGGLMIGRFMGAFALSDVRKRVRHGLVVLVPVLAFAVIWLLSGRENALHYGPMLAVLLVAFFLGEASAHRMLVLFSLIIMGLLLTGMLASGETAKWAVLGVGLFCSVMWSNIFALVLEGLGPLKSQASSLLIMAVLGFALVPPLQGLFADKMGVQFSFVVPMGAFAYIAFYGLYGYRVGRQKEAVNN